MRGERNTRGVVVAALAAVIVGCAAAPGPARPPPARPPDRTACPLGIEGANVSTELTEGGIALVVTARAEDVPEIRERAHDAARLHGPFGRVGKGHDGRHGLGGEHGLRGLALPPAHAASMEITGGARIELVPTHAEDRTALRERVRERAEIMQTMPCDVGPKEAPP